MPTQYGDTEIIADAQRMPSEAMSLSSRGLARYQCGELVTARGSGLCHSPVDVTFDGAYGKSQSLGDRAVGQPLTNERHDLSFAVRERHWFAGVPKRRAPYTAALFG